MIELTKRDIEILKAMSSIDDNIMFFGGSNRLWNHTKNINVMMVATLSFEIPNAGEKYPFGNLKKLINMLKLHKEPKIVFGENGLEISSEKRSALYPKTLERFIPREDSPFDIPSSSFSAHVSKDDFNDWKKSGAIVEGKHFYITHKGLLQKNSVTQQKLHIDLETEGEDRPFVCAIDPVRISVMENADYKLEINFQHNVVKFTRMDEQTTYYLIAFEKGSSRYPK